MSNLRNQVVSWYFNNFNQSKIAQSYNRDPKHKDEIWAMLLTQAISSFNQGLEDKIDPEDRRAAKCVSRNEIVDFVGQNAYKKIAYLVTASAVHKMFMDKE